METHSEFEIDIEKLDVECASLPAIYNEYAESLAEEECTIRELKLKIEDRETELKKEIYDNAKEYCKEYCVSSLTEAFIRTLIATDTERATLQYALLQADKNKRMLECAVRALEVKNAELKSLVTLFQAEYFTEKDLSDRNRLVSEALEKFKDRDVKTEAQNKTSKKQITINC